MSAARRVAQALVYTNVVEASAAASLTYATDVFFGVAVSWSARSRSPRASVNRAA